MQHTADGALLRMHSSAVPLPPLLHLRLPAADAVLQQTPPEMLTAGKKLLVGMEEPLLTLSLALCASKR